MRLVLFLIIFCVTLTAHSADKDCLAIAIHKEAAPRSVEDGKAVLQVIENRMRFKGKSACAVIKEPNQFSFVTEGMSWKASKRQLNYLEHLRSVDDVVTSDTVYFHHKRVKWKYAKKKQFVKQIGVHKYYKEK